MAYGGLKHGTISGYTYWGCRCDPCRETHAEYVKKSRAKMKAKGEKNPELIPHGTGSGYRNWGCRCELCRRRSYRETRHWLKTGTMILEDDK